MTHSKTSQSNEKIVGLVNLHSGCGTKKTKQCKRLWTDRHTNIHVEHGQQAIKTHSSTVFIHLHSILIKQLVSGKQKKISFVK